ncbi:MAG: molybdopterin cofactor-binding domain-containing protein [Pikeienuella sp.]|uniref:xanthine dehydrogenase family protein molybdopterin-binding subunit n=1 Tax=Pikeienuella sp. TaxID=2831957 RepID=UPI00391BA3EF
MDRRSFLAMLSGASACAVFAPPARALPTIPGRPEPTAEAASTWIAFRDGRYALSLPRAELGQNISTAMKQIACAELGVGWDELDVIQADTAAIAPYRATVGSESVQDFVFPLAQACASLRGALAAGRTGRIDTDERPVSELLAFRPGALGGAAPLVGGEAIVTGAPLFAADIRLPGMTFGRVVRAEASPEIGSRPLRWNAAAARAEPGFVALVEGDDLDLNDSEGLGIVAETPGALDRIEAALAVEWEIDEAPAEGAIAETLDIDRRLARGGARYDLADDRVDETAPWDVDLRIDTPLAAHSPIEPRCAVADMGAKGGRLWTGTQDAFFVRDTLVDQLGFDEEALVVIPQRVGGGFGGKVVPMVEREAAALSRAAGRPVKVQWTRAQEFALAYHRPPTSHRVRARLKDGRIDAWSHRFASGHVIYTSAVLPAWMQTFTDFLGDDGAARNALPPYDFAALSVGYDLERLPVRTGAWRGLGAGPNTLAIEMAMDLCAARAGLSPVEFRLGHVSDPRLRRVLEAVAALAGPAPEAGRGVGCGVYKGVSYGAVIADLAFRESGEPFVSHVYCAHDCGVIVNADQVRAQCEGNVMWSIGMVLSDRLTLRGAAIRERDFADAPIPTMRDAPPIEIALIDGGEPPVGAGETLMASAPAAIANGWASLAGATPARLPVGS